MRGGVVPSNDQPFHDPGASPSNGSAAINVDTELQGAGGHQRVSVLTLNVRSVRTKAKQLAVMQAMRELGPKDITVLCETWLTTPLVHRIAGVRALQSPLAPHQGVLIVLGERVTDVQPVVPGLWSPRLIVAKVHIGDLNDRVTVIGHYSPPGERAASDKELMYAVKVLSEQGQAKHLVVAGDLNRSGEDARALASKLNLVLA